MIKSTRHNENGFTIIELMIATAVFSVVLLVCAVGLLQVGRSYYKGVTTARTQEVARTILDEISQNIQFGSGTVNTLNNNNGSIGYCVGDKTYSYIPNRQLIDTAPTGDQSRHVLAVDDSISTCSAGIPAQNMLGNPAGRELMTTRMRLSDFTITRLGANELYRVTVRVVSGERDLLVDRNSDNQITAADNPVQCKNDRAGTQFCAVSELTTTVQKRVR
jgi:prepilin-type N-terminal cleavage/methylation domain-containing protein